MKQPPKRSKGLPCLTKAETWIDDQSIKQRRHVNLPTIGIKFETRQDKQQNTDLQNVGCHKNQNNQNMCRRKNIYSNGVMRYRQRDKITEWIPDIDSVRQFRRTNRPRFINKTQHNVINVTDKLCNIVLTTKKDHPSTISIIMATKLSVHILTLLHTWTGRFVFLTESRGQCV